MATAVAPPSFAVGDRVVLEGLQSATHLNGRHGCIAREQQQGRYAVDIDVDSQRRAIKPINLLREELDNNDDDNMIVADAVEGILPENHGRAASYLLDLMRLNVAWHFSFDEDIRTHMDIERLRSSPAGLLKISHLTALGWSNWITEGGDGLDVGTGDSDNPMGMYEMMKATMDQVINDSEEIGVPEIEAPRMVFAKDALQSPHAAGGWHVRVHGNFWIVGSSQDTGAAYLIPELSKSMVYEVLGIRNALYPMVATGPFTRPVLMAATLIPWYGRLLYDGVVMPAHGMRIPQQASPVLAEKLQAAVDTAVNGGRVISQLRDTQRVPSVDPAHPRLVPNRDPPTEEEGRYMEQLAALPAPVQASMENNFDEVKPWSWTFRRMGYTEEENPNHMGMVIRGIGDVLGPFSCSALAPTSVDILRSTVTYSRQLNRQPSVLSIDERVCCERLKFLLQATDVRIHYYRPPSKEETNAAMAAGGI
jgi:hypothetical protein